MSTFDIPLRVCTFLLLTVILYTTGPSISDFKAESIIEYAVFYANLSVFFFAGIFMRGVINRRFCLMLGISIILCHYFFYTFLTFAGDNTYLKVWSFFVGTLPLYLGVTYFTLIQAKCLNFLERMGVSDDVADKIVGPVGTTNLSIIFSAYVAFWLLIDFLLATYCISYGLYYGSPHNELLTPLMAANGHFNVFFGYDVLVLTVDAFFTILIAHRAIVDQKRPDALGVGPTMYFDSSKALKTSSS